MEASAPSCIFVSQPNRGAFSFFNTCGEKLYISACVTDALYDKKLYTSGKTIQNGGRYTIYIPYPPAKNLEWAADPFTPPLLPNCKPPKK